ncbi:DUF4442 domain-containing protein [Eudoraea chungangensis]|uniref:DUF4442 domain-containing protein n=1 Tax=Eudoraea chungangensis TaxID=1481905 RepID=UPI0023EC927E|nr:DUF4442 domain-containing protein [Eudoraea chungangensis]
MDLPLKTNLFTFFKLPSAWWSGVRLKSVDDESAVVTLKHSWFNQNPFKSIFWAVLGMAAELSTGVLVMTKIRESGQSISMLVANNNANFSKKATGKISFKCVEGSKLQKIIDQVITTGEGQTVWLQSVGTNREGVVVATFNFEWALKLRK